MEVTDSAQHSKSLWVIYLVVLVATLGYGISFPLLAIRLESLGVSGALIGINAAMPALGWILASLIAPRLQARFGVRAVTLGFLILALAAFAGIAFVSDYWSSTLLRFFFGGGIGMFYRSIEYWINGVSDASRRGRNLAFYSVFFMLGIALGSLVQPALGNKGLGAFGPVLMLLALAALLLGAWRNPVTPALGNFAQARFSAAALWIAPAAFLAAHAYGLFEDIPAYLMSIYAMRNGLGEEIAAYTLTAAALGNILLPIPIGMISDRVGRIVPLIVAATVVVCLSAVIPWTLAHPELFLATIVIWAGFAGSIYGLSLAMIGDRTSGGALVTANATFGIIYSLGSLIGPVINGAALDRLNTHGVMVSAAGIFALLVMSIGIVTVMNRRRQPL